MSDRLGPDRPSEAHVSEGHAGDRTSDAMVRPLDEYDGRPLTDQERSVLRMLVEGNRNREISRRMGISESTVKFHVRGLCDKLGASSRTQVVSLAFMRGMVHH